MVPSTRLGGFRRVHPRRVYTIALHGPCPVRRSADRPGGTELPGLTSDPIYTADRRGGILISSGPERCPVWVLNPSNRDRPRPAAFAFTSECPVTLKGIGLGSPPDPKSGGTPAAPRGATFAFHSEGAATLKAVEPQAPSTPLTWGGFAPRVRPPSGTKTARRAPARQFGPPRGPCNRWRIGVARMEAVRSSRGSHAWSRRVASAQPEVRAGGEKDCRARGPAHASRPRTCTVEGWWSRGGSARARGTEEPGRERGGPDRPESDTAWATGPTGRAARGVHGRAEKSGLCSSERATHSSRCSMPCLETLASVISSGIQSGLSAGASSCQAHPS